MYTGTHQVPHRPQYPLPRVPPHHGTEPARSFTARYSGCQRCSSGHTRFTRLLLVSTCVASKTFVSPKWLFSLFFMNFTVFSRNGSLFWSLFWPELTTIPRCDHFCWKVDPFLLKLSIFHEKWCFWRILSIFHEKVVFLTEFAALLKTEVILPRVRTVFPDRVYDHFRCFSVFFSEFQ